MSGGGEDDCGVYYCSSSFVSTGLLHSYLAFEVQGVFEKLYLGRGCQVWLECRVCDEPLLYERGKF